MTICLTRCCSQTLVYGFSMPYLPWLFGHINLLSFKPWISKGILKSIKRKNDLFKKIVRCKNNIIKTQKYEEYRVLKNNLNEIISRSKKMYYEKYFTTTNNNLKKII